MSDRDSAKRKRDRAIKQLRDLGMSDDEIAAELGVDSIASDQAAEIIDAEIVSEEDLSNESPMESGPTHLPAVIPQPIADSTERVGRDWSKSSVPERRCKAHKKDGEQCKNAAIHGATVCRYHGGAAKHVKQAARARLDNASDLMAKQLLRMAIDDDVADAVKLTAIRDALDRAGLKAPNEVVVSAGSQTGFDDVFNEIVYGAHVESEPVETQAQSTRFFNDPNTAPVDADEYAQSAEQAPWPSDSDRPAPQHEREHREGRQAQWESPQNGSHAITGLDAMRLANELRALPPGRDDW